MKPLFLASFTLLSLAVIGQSNPLDVSRIRVIQPHFSTSQLVSIYNADPNRLTALFNYFTNSYTCTTMDGALLDNESVYNLDLFDVSEFESLRQESATVNFTYKNKVVIELMSGNELEPTLNGYTPHQLAHEMPARDFPVWNYTEVNLENYKLYREEVDRWAVDFPQEYLEINQDPSIMHVSFSELYPNRIDKLNTLFSDSNIHYILID